MTSTLYDRLFISYWCIDFILCSIQKNVIVFTPQWICISCSFSSWTDWHSLIFDTYCWSFPRSNLYHCICSASMDEPHLCEDIQLTRRIDCLKNWCSKFPQSISSPLSLSGSLSHTQTQTWKCTSFFIPNKPYLEVDVTGETSKGDKMVKTLGFDVRYHYTELFI